MDNPVYSTQGILGKLAGTFRSCFGEIRQFRRFQEIITAMDTFGRRSVAHLNSTILDHATRSSMNRFLSWKIDQDLIFAKTIKDINSVERDGILAIDDAISEKTGKSIDAAGRIFDHTGDRSV
jgi:hypothetical protein